MKTIALAHLKGACAEQVELFKKVFPKGAVVSVAVAETALDAGLNVFYLCKFVTVPALVDALLKS